MTKVQQVAIRGDPDLFIVCNGRAVAMELKRDVFQAPDPLQAYKLRGIEAAGGYGLVVSPETWIVAYDFLTKLTQASRLEHLEAPQCLRLPTAI